MGAIITVLKSELEIKPEFLNIISAMASDIKKLPNGYAFSPKPGKLYELLNYLKENGLIRLILAKSQAASKEAMGCQLSDLAF